MKINLALITSIIVAVGLVAFGFTAFQISSEREKLNTELEAKTIRTSEEFYNNYLERLALNDSTGTDTSFILKVTDSVINQYRLKGIAIYFNADSIIPLNNDAAKILPIPEPAWARARSDAMRAETWERRVAEIGREVMRVRSVRSEERGA